MESAVCGHRSQMAESDEEGADGSDSDYGLSDRQMQDIWVRFQADSNQACATEEIRMDSLDESPCDCQDDDFGLSDWQLDRLRKQVVATPTANGEPWEVFGDSSPSSSPAADPLRAFAKQKKRESVCSQQQVDDPQTPTRERGHGSPENTPDKAAPRARARTSMCSRQSQEAFIEAQLPKRDLEWVDRHQSLPWRLQVQLLSCKRLDGITWYFFRVQENNDSRFYLKRFNDFKQLHKALTSCPNGCRFRVPPLPPSGRFGVRHLLDLGSFNQKRKQSLQCYVEDLMSQVKSLSDDPVLVNFFGRGAAGRVCFDEA